MVNWHMWEMLSEQLRCGKELKTGTHTASCLRHLPCYLVPIRPAVDYAAGKGKVETLGTVTESSPRCIFKPK